MKKYVSIGIILVILSVFAVSSCAAPAKEQTPEEFYKDKTIEFFIPAPPGGGFDTCVRLAVPWLETHSGAKVYPVNKPGGGTLLAVNYLYTSTKPDGLSLGLVAYTLGLTAQIVGEEGVEYDMEKFEWIANMTSRDFAFFINSKLPYKTLEDLLRAPELKIAEQSVGGSASQLSRLVLEPLGVKTNVIPGWTGANPMTLSVAKGEADAAFLSANNFMGALKEGLVRLIFVLADERMEMFPDTPTIFEALPAGASKDVEFWAKTMNNMGVIHRVVAATPGTPKDRVEFLREAYKKVMQEKKLISNMNKALTPAHFLPGDDVEMRLKETLAMGQERMEQLRSAMTE